MPWLVLLLASLLVASLLVPGVPALIYCARQRPRWPYFLAAFLGASSFCCVTGWVSSTIILQYSCSMGLPEAFGHAYLAGVLGAYAGPAVVACFLGPAERKAGARMGMGIGFLSGALLTLLAIPLVRDFSVRWFEDPRAWALCAVLGGALAGTVGALIGPYVRESWKRHAAARRR